MSPSTESVRSLSKLELSAWSLSTPESFSDIEANKLRVFTTLGVLLYCFQNCSELVGELCKVGEYGPEEEEEEVEEVLDLRLNEDVEPVDTEEFLGRKFVGFQGVEYIESMVTAFFLSRGGTHNEKDLGLRTVESLVSFVSISPGLCRGSTDSFISCKDWLLGSILGLGSGFFSLQDTDIVRRGLGRGLTRSFKAEVLIVEDLCLGSDMVPVGGQYLGFQNPLCRFVIFVSSGCGADFISALSDRRTPSLLLLC